MPWTGVVQKRPMPVSAAVSSNDATLGLSSAASMWWVLSRFLVEYRGIQWESRNCPFITVALLCLAIVVAFVSGHVSNVLLSDGDCIVQVGWSLDPTAGTASPVSMFCCVDPVQSKIKILYEESNLSNLRVSWHHITITFKHIRHYPQISPVLQGFLAGGRVVAWCWHRQDFWCYSHPGESD